MTYEEAILEHPEIAPELSFMWERKKNEMKGKILIWKSLKSISPHFTNST